MCDDIIKLSNGRRNYSRLSEQARSGLPPASLLEEIRKLTEHMG